MGADPVAYAIAAASWGRDLVIDAFSVRKEAKAHGTGQLIEGNFRPGDEVVVVEDVITSGGSALKAIEAVEGAGGRVVGVLAVVDREQGGREKLTQAGHRRRIINNYYSIRPDSPNHHSLDGTPPTPGIPPSAGRSPALPHSRNSLSQNSFSPRGRPPGGATRILHPRPPENPRPSLRCGTSWEQLGDGTLRARGSANERCTSEHSPAKRR